MQQNPEPTLHSGSVSYMYRTDMDVRSRRLPHGENDAFVASFTKVTSGEDTEFYLSLSVVEVVGAFISWRFGTSNP